MKNNKGFSLIEIVIFCFIGITLLTLFIGLAMNSREFARTIGCVNNMKNITQAVENFQADYRMTPANLEDLYPMYIENRQIFKCPADRTTDANSYEKFYIGRFIASEESNKVFLVCPRHYRKDKTVAAYLSYAVDIGRNSRVTWSGTAAEYGEEYTGGQLTFADGTTVSIDSGTVGLAASFIDNQNKLYSIIYTPEDEEGSITVNHQGDSSFEVITPAVIAGVEGTSFRVRNRNFLQTAQHLTEVDVMEGSVYVEDRSKGTPAITVAPNYGTLGVTVNTSDEAPLPPGLKKRIPRKPLPPRWIDRFK